MESVNGEMTKVQKVCGKIVFFLENIRKYFILIIDFSLLNRKLLQPDKHVLQDRDIQ